jgi:hypothetical protein
MFLVTQDRFLQDKELVLAEAFRFLGVDDRFVPGDLASRKQPGHYHPMTQRMVRLANTISHYRDEAKLRALLRRRVARLAGRSPQEAANLIQVKVLKGAHPRLSEQCRAELAERTSREARTADRPGVLRLEGCPLGFCGVGMRR